MLILMRNFRSRYGLCFLTIMKIYRSSTYQIDKEYYLELIN